MRCFIALAFIALALGQNNQETFTLLLNFFNQNNNDYTIDYVHNYRFVEHEHQNGKHILVAISDATTDRTCHVIEVSNTWEIYLEDHELLGKITEELYQLITTHTVKETDLSLVDLIQKYGDANALMECFNHKVYTLTYIPSFTASTTQKVPEVTR